MRNVQVATGRESLETPDLNRRTPAVDRMQCYDLLYCIVLFFPPLFRQTKRHLAVLTLRAWTCSLSVLLTKKCFNLLCSCMCSSFCLINPRSSAVDQNVFKKLSMSKVLLNGICLFFQHCATFDGIQERFASPKARDVSFFFFPFKKICHGAFKDLEMEDKDAFNCEIKHRQ